MQEVSQLAWSMATLNFTSENLCSLVSELVAAQLETAAAGGGQLESSFSSPSSPSVSWPSSAGGGRGDALAPRSALAPISRSGSAVSAPDGGREWGMASLSSVAWAYAVMRPGDTRLFAAVFAHADAVLGGPAGDTENESEGDDYHWQDVGRRSQDGLQSREEESEEPGMESNDIRSMRQVGALPQIRGPLCHALNYSWGRDSTRHGCECL